VPSTAQILLLCAAFLPGFIFGAINFSSVLDLAANLNLTLQQLRIKGASGNWYPARFERSGVLRNDAARAQAGYTLYTLAPDLSAHLVDMDGRELHRWSLSRDEVLPAAATDPRTFFGRLDAQVEGGYMFANGDLLMVYEQKAIGPWDTLLVKLDKNSHVLWKSELKAHHAVAVWGDKIYALTGEIQPPSSSPVVPNLRGMPYIDERVSILDSDGKELSTHSILQAMANSERLRVADVVPPSDRIDALHSNAIDVLTEQNAGFIPGAKPGDVLLSLRNLDMLVVMDLASDKIIWALRGGWRGQHDAKMLLNGHILLFDNQGGITGGRSRVLEIVPDTGAIVWSFGGTAGDRLDSEIRGGAQRLSGGNTLISDSTAGRILEVTPEGTVVWEYLDPLVVDENGQRLVASLGLTVTRYDPSAVSFLGSSTVHEASH
jgi:hypothetical protein